MSVWATRLAASTCSPVSPNRYVLEVGAAPSTRAASESRKAGARVKMRDMIVLRLLGHQRPMGGPSAAPGPGRRDAQPGTCAPPHADLARSRRFGAPGFVAS